MKITLVFNNSNWQSIQEKTQTIRDFFSPLSFPIEITSIYYVSAIVPSFISVGVYGGITNTPGTTMTIDPMWFDSNISKIAPNSDITVYCLMPSDVSPSRTSVGIMQGKFGNTIQCCIFGINENDHAYVNEIDQGNAFVLYVCHEICHAIALIQSVPDNTHLNFYSGHPTHELEDLKEGKLTKLYQLLAHVKKLILYLTIQINQTKIMQPQPIVKSQITTSYVKIYKWAKAIEIGEGSESSLNNPGNLKMSSLIQSWGGSVGRNATDGGVIAQFSTYNQGLQALCNFLTLGCEDELKAFHQARTLQKFSEVYAGNPPQGYINGIASKLGVPVDIDISTFLL